MPVTRCEEGAPDVCGREASFSGDDRQKEDGDRTIHQLRQTLLRFFFPSYRSCSRSLHASFRGAAKRRARNPYAAATDMDFGLAGLRPRRGMTAEQFTCAPSSSRDCCAGATTSRCQRNFRGQGWSLELSPDWGQRNGASSAWRARDVQQPSCFRCNGAMHIKSASWG